MDAPGGLRRVLEGACGRCGPGLLALSGGLDSTIIAYLMRDRLPGAVAVIARDFVSTDLTYSQMASRGLGVPLEILEAGTDEVLDAAAQAVRILRCFNDIAVRNGAAIYLALRRAADLGHGAAVTGDGADELFAGYDYMVKKPPAELGAELARMRAVMHFDSHEIGRDLGVRVESPFLDPAVAEAAAAIPPGEMVGERGGRRYGKMPLREAFEDRIPARIAWRPKSPMQDGSGTAGLTGLFESVVGGEAYAEKKTEARERDGVVIRSRESMHYYEEYRRLYGPPGRGGGGDPCPYCGTGTGGSRFCRMCGAFPV